MRWSSAPSEPCGNSRGLASLELGGRDLVGGKLRAGGNLLRAAFPGIAVATLIPMALFYLTLAAGSIVWAIGVSVLYAYGFAAFQYRRRRRVSGMLLMTVFMVTVRAVSAVAVWALHGVLRYPGGGDGGVRVDVRGHHVDERAADRALGSGSGTALSRRPGDPTGAHPGIVLDLDGDLPGQRGDDP